MRYQTVAAIIFADALPVQASAKTTESAAPSKVAAELTKTVQLLDAVMAEATSTLENARSAARQAEAAKVQAKAESKEAVEKLTGDTQQNLQALVAAMEAHLGVVKAQRDQLAAAIPPLETLGDRVCDAEKMPKLPVVPPPLSPPWRTATPREASNTMAWPCRGPGPAMPKYSTQ